MFFRFMGMRVFAGKFLTLVYTYRVGYIYGAPADFLDIQHLSRTSRGMLP